MLRGVLSIICKVQNGVRITILEKETENSPGGRTAREMAINGMIGTAAIPIKWTEIPPPLTANRI